MKKVAIIGAGFSGLSLAHELNKLAVEVHVYDARPGPGGMVATGQSSFGFYEMAANGFLNTVEIEKFFKENQITALGSSVSAKKRFIYFKKPSRWPFTIGGTFVFSYFILRAIFKGREFRRPQKNETIRAWAERLVGTHATEYLVAAGFQGIYAGDIGKMSASLILGPLFNRAKKRAKPTLKCSLLSAQGGLGSIMNQLQTSLEKRGVHFHFGTSWSKALTESRFDHLVVATSFFDAEKILKESNSEVQAPAIDKNIELLRQVEALPLVSVTCFFVRPPRKYQGFGVLFPKAEGIRALGVLMNSFIFERNTEISKKYYSETWILGGALQPDIQMLNDDEIIKLITENRAQVFQEHEKILTFQLHRWPRALPHYTIELERIIEQFQPMQGISLHGNYLGSIGLSRILEKSQKLAMDIHSKLEKII